MSVVLVACATKVERQSAPAQPTKTFPEPWGAEAPADEPAPADEQPAEEAEPPAAAEQPAEQPADDGGESLLCCDTVAKTADGTHLTGCRMIEADVSARNACIDGGKTLKSCKDAECSGGTCRCSN